MKRQRHWSYTGEKRRKAVLRRDNWECQIRGPMCIGTATTVDHIHPKAWGGTEDVSNLRAACKPCNQSKGARADTTQMPRFFRNVLQQEVGSSRVDLQACKLEYSIVSPK